MTNIQAAIGVAQMEYADKLVQARIDNAQLYTKLLKDVKGITLPPQAPWTRNVYWMYGILIEDDFGMSMSEVMKELEKKGVETRAFFIPMHQQPVYMENMKKDDRFPDVQGTYPVSEELSRKGLYLPSSSCLTKEQIREVADALISLKR